MCSGPSTLRPSIEPLKLWSCITDGLKIKVLLAYKIALWDKLMWSYNLTGDLKIKGCKIEGPL